MKLLLIGAFFAIFSNVHGNSSYVRKLPFNITGKWYLPNSNSPVFYLHFRDRISWIEADAVCQFHHSELVTVDKPNQFEDVKAYLKQLGYDKPVWIGLQRLYNESMEWRDGSILSTDEYWKQAPDTNRSVCVMSSPADNYRWIANPCNGPGTASFICEMPIPKWVKKSACLEAVNPSIIVTFHPEKTMIKAGTVCQNSDVKYIECHDPSTNMRFFQQGVNEKVEENKKMMREHLICSSQSNETPLSQINTTATSTSKVTNILSTTTSTTSQTPIVLPVKATNIPLTPSTAPTPITKLTSKAELKSTEIPFKSSPPLNIGSESSTISLPQEMSFAEEPIRASKPFVEKEPTEYPEAKPSLVANTTESSHHKNVNSIKLGLNLIPTSQPVKTKPEKSTSSATELPKENSSILSYIVPGTTEVSSNVTPVEESHEIYNNDKEREIFQDSVSTPVKKVVKLEVVENVGNSLKNIVSKSSESEEDQGDRTYNIEGTFDSNDFTNVDSINVYKKIDLNPAETNVNPSFESTQKPADVEFEKSTPGYLPSSKKLQDPKSFSVSFTSASSPEPSSNKATSSPNATPNTTENASTTTPIQNLIILEPRNETMSEEEAKKRSALLSGSEETDENYPNRKRRIINSKRHSFYPYFLGRIWG
ncbi:uncharacterized protein LOC135832537 isoform X2 [Planococcus citri]|uniref:uncharacterized protein LOC135832537 isoform X2 n=1 Tax=Planococcus citri TaxID=170843 RepID=UPI0031F9B0B0